MPYKNKQDCNKQRKRIAMKFKGKTCHKHGGTDGVPIGPHCRKCNNASVRKWVLSDPRRTLLLGARQRARKFGVLFRIILSDITIPDACPVLGIKLIPGIGAMHDGSPTLDRIIPDLGYVLGNIQVISLKANRIKNNASIEELEKVLAYVKRSS